jgi:DNA gyrase subunit A
MGRPASGVTGIMLGKGDAVVGMDLVRPGAEILVVTRLGQGKRVPRTLEVQSLQTHRLEDVGAHGPIRGGVSGTKSTRPIPLS